MTVTRISIGSKGVRRKLSMVVDIKMVMHACPLHVAKMMQCMLLTRVYILTL